MDCTVGRGGHALEIVKRLAPRGEVGGDGCGSGEFEVCEGAAGARGSRWGKVWKFARFMRTLGEAVDVLDALEIERVDGLLADFGVSTNQLLAASHGLSFNEESALDMRLDPRIEKKASDLLKEWDDRRIAEVLQDYAQEKFAWRIARKIIQTRDAEPILTTGQLARLVRSVVPGKWGRIDPATRTFQALADGGELGTGEFAGSAGDGARDDGSRRTSGVYQFSFRRGSAGEADDEGVGSERVVRGADEEAGGGERGRDGKESAIAECEDASGAVQRVSGG